MSVPSRKVQIIEDEAALRDALGQKLKDEGFLVLTADDGVKGLDQALIEQPDLILLDIKMPQMGGFQMLKQLRSGGGWGASVPVVFLTNLSPSSTEEQEDIAAVQPTDYIIKGDVTLDEIAQKVKKLLSM